MNCYDQIYVKFLTNKMGHAFLIETKNISNSEILLIDIVKKIMCPKTFDINCKEKCNLCYQLENRKFPSLIIVEPNGNNINRDQIENIKYTFSKESMFGKYNIYIIKYVEKLNSVSANILLKFLEEPVTNTVCFMLTEDKTNVLSTIISRCELYKDHFDRECQNEYSADVLLCANLIDSADEQLFVKIKEVLKDNIKDRQYINNFFKSLFLFYYQKLSNAINRIEILKISEKIKIINKYLDNSMYNVNIELLLNCFAIQIINGGKNDC